MKLSVLDFATPEEAFSRARDGDRIYFPGRYPFQPQYFAPEGGFKIRKAIEVFGDGMCHNGIQTGSVIFGKQTGTPEDPIFDDAFVVDFTDSSEIGPIYFHDFKIPNSKNGIRCELSEDQSVQSVVAERVNIFNAKEAGFRLLGFDATAMIESVAISACVSSFSKERGVWLKHVRGARMTDRVSTRTRSARWGGPPRSPRRARRVGGPLATWPNTGSNYIIDVSSSDRRLYPDAEASFEMRS